MKPDVDPLFSFSDTSLPGPLSLPHAGRHGDPGRPGQLSGEAAPGQGALVCKPDTCSCPAPNAPRSLAAAHSRRGLRLRHVNSGGRDAVPSTVFSVAPESRGWNDSQRRAAAWGPPSLWEANARQLHPQRTTEVRAWGSGGPARYALMEKEPQGGDEDGVGARPCR